MQSGILAWTQKQVKSKWSLEFCGWFYTTMPRLSVIAGILRLLLWIFPRVPGDPSLHLSIACCLYLGAFLYTGHHFDLVGSPLPNFQTVPTPILTFWKHQPTLGRSNCWRLQGLSTAEVPPNSPPAGSLAQVSGTRSSHSRQALPLYSCWK